MSRRAQVHTSFLGLFALVLLIPIIWPPSWFPKFALAAVDGEATPADFKATLIRAGLGADALCAAGVSSGTISSVLSATAAAINATPTRLSAADASYATARRDVDRLKALIESGRGSEQDVSAYSTAVTALASATAERETALDAFFTAGAANLTSGQRTVLQKIRANRAYELPLEFLTVERSQQDWVNVRDALANERISAQLGEDPDSGAQSALATWRANETVAAAKSSLNANLSTVTSSWNTAAQ